MDKGYIDIKVDVKIEYLDNNKVNIYFTINEGNAYLLSSLEILDKNNILSKNTLKIIEEEKENFVSNQNYFSAGNIKEFRQDISDIIINNGIDFFEIVTFDKVENTNVNILFEILPISPKYTKQINIVGNNRTFDYVIRRELELVEGDAFTKSQLNLIREKLISLNLFESVRVSEKSIDNNFSDIIIDVVEKQTGSFNAGLSVGTLDGFAIVTGLRERNFYGTGRSLDILLNTSSDNNEIKIITSDRLSYENDANISNGSSCIS